jgi:predicted alpha/beta superfamily hydrolase
LPITEPKPFVDPLLETMTLTSAINGAEYEIRISLPKAYRHTDQAYPIMVVLDAEFTFYQAAEIAFTEAMWSLAPLKGAPTPIPEFLVVSVGLPSSPPNPFRRNFEYMPPVDLADLSDHVRGYMDRIEVMLGRGPEFGGAATFQQVLADELLPAIEKTYRIDPSFRILFGQSASGCFAAFNLVTRPELFTDYIIVSPGLMPENFRLEEAWAAAHSDLTARVLLTVGERENGDPLEIFEATARFSEALLSRGYPSLDLKAWIIPEADHIKTAAPSIAQGLARLGKLGLSAGG